MGRVTALASLSPHRKEEMAHDSSKLTSIVEAYLADIRRTRASGGATGELSIYPALNGLFNAIGATLRPKVFSVQELANQGAGHPDFGLYAASQVQRGSPRQGQVPACGVVEVKPPDDDAWLTAKSDQVSDYWDKYRLVLVTNTRDFVLLGEDSQGSPATVGNIPPGGLGEKNSQDMLMRPRASSQSMSVPPLENTSAACCLIERDSPIRGTWHGCWRPMRATDWLGWRPPATRRI